jgi:hypothetical protein
LRLYPITYLTIPIKNGESIVIEHLEISQKSASHFISQNMGYFQNWIIFIKYPENQCLVHLISETLKDIERFTINQDLISSDVWLFKKR